MGHVCGIINLIMSERGSFNVANYGTERARDKKFRGFRTNTESLIDASNEDLLQECNNQKDLKAKQRKISAAKIKKLKAEVVADEKNIQTKCLQRRKLEKMKKNLEASKDANAAKELVKINQKLMVMQSDIKGMKKKVEAKQRRLSEIDEN